MRIRPSVSIFLTFHLAACGSGSGTTRVPGSIAPVVGRGSEPAVTSPPQAAPRRPETDSPDDGPVPVRAAQAPLVHVRDALEVDSLLGRRVRVAGRCTAAGEGRTAGSWTLKEADAAIEVRGLVPSSCARNGEDLTIFAQVEPKAAGSRDRLLLRLPD